MHLCAEFFGGGSLQCDGRFQELGSDLRLRAGVFAGPRGHTAEGRLDLTEVGGFAGIGSGGHFVGAFIRLRLHDCKAEMAGSRVKETVGEMHTANNL